jgi:hypothetical protein
MVWFNDHKDGVSFGSDLLMIVKLSAKFCLKDFISALQSMDTSLFAPSTFLTWNQIMLPTSLKVTLEGLRQG